MARAQAAPSGFIRRIEKPDVFPFGTPRGARGKTIYSGGEDTCQELAVVCLVALYEMLVPPVVIHLSFDGKASGRRCLPHSTVQTFYFNWRLILTSEWLSNELSVRGPLDFPLASAFSS